MNSVEEISSDLIALCNLIGVSRTEADELIINIFKGKSYDSFRGLGKFSTETIALLSNILSTLFDYSPIEWDEDPHRSDTYYGIITWRGKLFKLTWVYNSWNDDFEINLYGRDVHDVDDSNIREVEKVSAYQEIRYS